MSEDFALELKAIYKSFGEQKVHQGIDIKIVKGKSAIVVGQSGAGKSVMLKYFTGLMKPDSGEVKVFGQDIAKMKRRELYDVRSRLGVLFQSAALFDSLTTFENVALPLREKTKLSELQIRESVLEKLDLVGMADAKDKYPSELSGGMQKRVGLARALQRDPDIVLFDEPTTGLDPETTHYIYDLFSATQKKLGYTSLIVSHDIPKVFRIADFVAVLSNKEIQLCEKECLGEGCGNPWLIKMLELEKAGLKGTLL